MAITRRQFLKRTGLATAGTVASTSLFRNPLLQHALAATDNYLVVFYLDGGNDGLNTIVPYDNGSGSLRSHYMAARNTGVGGLRLEPAQILVPENPAPPMLDPNTGAQLGFHPGLQGIKNLYDLGKVAVIQGCGYPEPNLSHDEAATKWETGDPFGVMDGTGWVGRFLADTFLGDEIPGVNIRNNVAGEFIQAITGVLALSRVTDFAFPYGQGIPQAEQDLFAEAFLAVHQEAQLSSILARDYTGSTGGRIQQATVSYPLLSADYIAARPTFNQAYTNLASGPATSLREIAKVIHGTANNLYPGVVTARHFWARHGGFDTHSDQLANNVNNGQGGLFSDVANAIELFYSDIDDMQAGLADKVTILIWSEFSRRIRQNDSGTDHGSQGPVLLIGGKVNGGVYGNHPNIDPAPGVLDGDGNTRYSQDAGDPSRSTDMRDVYGTVMKHWLGIVDPSPLLPLDNPDPGDEDLYWTVPDFDMPLFVP
jgi:uncharacterized protein (DUF1501 family)